MRQTYTGQIYLPERGGIGRIYADIVIEERHRDEMAITSHPVEQGATITDHAYKKPSSIIIRGGVTDSKPMRNGLATVGTVQNTLDRPPLSPRDFYEKLLQLQAKREPFDICTLWRLYRNLLVKSLSVASDPNSENCLTFTAECQEVQIVQNAFANSQNPYATLPAPPERHLFKHTEPLLERGLLKLMPYLNGTGTWTAEGQARARQVDISRLPNVHVGSGGTGGAGSSSGESDSTPTEDPKEPETEVEFTVVDFWGDPVASPSQYMLGMNRAVPDTTYSVAAHPTARRLYAIDGWQVEREAPYMPQAISPSAAQNGAALRGDVYHKMTVKDLRLKGLTLSADTIGRPTKHLIELETGVDYCVLMAFLDHHSGNIHGSGHAGALIIDGKSRQGLYTDLTRTSQTVTVTRDEQGVSFTEQQTLELGEVRFDELSMEPEDNFGGESRLTPGKGSIPCILVSSSGKLDEDALGRAFSYINQEYSAGILSYKWDCNAGGMLNGPDHENWNSISCEKGFMVNGIVGWAAFALPRGAYAKMLEYARKKQVDAEDMRTWNESEYSTASYNCMTYALDILDKGMGYEKSPGKPRTVDHPNAHIREYMDQAHESGYFDDRMWRGEDEAVSGRKQTITNGVRHRKRAVWASFPEEDIK